MLLSIIERTNKVDIHAKSQENGVTALHEAVARNHLNVVKLLTKAGGIRIIH